MPHCGENLYLAVVVVCVFFRFVFGTILFGPGRSTDGKKIYMETSRHKTRQGSTRVVVAEYSVPYADVDEPRCLCSFVYYCLVPCVCVFGEQLLIRDTLAAATAVANFRNEINLLHHHHQHPPSKVWLL